MKKNYIIITLLSISLFGAGLQAQTDKAKYTALETLGSTSAMLMYNTYFCIGSIADNYETNKKKEDAITLLAEQVNGMKIIADNYDKLLNSGFLTDESDQVFVTKVIRCANHLQMEASSMKSYVETGSKNDVQVYSTNRDSAWDLIADMLGLKK